MNAIVLFDWIKNYTWDKDNPKFSVKFTTMNFWYVYKKKWIQIEIP